MADYEGLIICVGKDWEDFRCLFPERDNIEYVESMELFPPELSEYKLMYLMEFGSFLAGYKERCESGLFSYDEILVLVYMFSIYKSYGEKHPEKRFYRVNPFFLQEGLMSICDKVQLPYAYAEANGFVPVISLTNSGETIYSVIRSKNVFGFIREKFWQI